MDMNKVARVASLLFLAVIALTAQAQQASPAQSRLQIIQDMRSLGFLVCANALVYFNQNGSPYDLRNKQSYQQGIKRLQDLAGNTNFPDIAAELERLRSHLDNVESLPQTISELRATEPSYARVLLPVIESHAQLQMLLDQQYAESKGGEVSGVFGELNALSRDIGQLLVGYQIAAFSRLGAEMWVLSEEQTEERDKNIVEAFNRLGVDYPYLGNELKRSESQYFFVRSMLLNQGGKWAPSGVERFMGISMVELDKIARESAR
ncbi:hypothetical protein D3C78_511540 [compost metagenome]|jgi:hypothetical protein